MVAEISPLYHNAQVMADWAFSCLYDYEVSHVNRVPLSGGVIFAANHVSFFDPPAIGAKVKRQINYFARDTLFKGLFGKYLVGLGTIPVARENAEIASLKAIFKSLKKGGAVAIYPEGTRSPDGQLAEPKAGAGMIACKSKAIVVPTRLFGTYEAYGRQRKFPKIGGRIHIVYGPPMTVEEIDPGKTHPERYLEASKRIMAQIAKLEAPKITVV